MVCQNWQGIRIRAEYGTAGFNAEYQAAVTGVSINRPTPVAGTLQWLIERFRETPAWLSLSPATRKKRENIFRQIIESAGRQPFTAITEAHIAGGRDKRGKTPHQARHFLDMMRCLYAWAKEAGFVKLDPAAGVKYPTIKTGEGFPIWGDSDVAAYEKHWPVGTKERVWFDLLSYTGLRRGDAVRLGKQHVREGEVVITTEKSGHRIEVIIPIHLFPALIETLRVGPTGDLHFIVGANGKPMAKDSFGNAFHLACRAAGIKKSAHGLRKLAATRAAEAGANIWQLNAMFGWTGTKMASYYTQQFERKRAAREGFKKLVANETQTSIPAPRAFTPAPRR